MTISLLIPVHDYDVFAFVSSVRGEIESIPELVEVIIGDDGSSADFANKYSLLADKWVKVVRSEKNIGRAAIRNKLIEASKGEYLIFVDQDVMIPGTVEEYINRWVSEAGGSTVVSGGIMYRNSSPIDPDKTLRWKYGLLNEQLKASERNRHPYRFFSTFNVMLKRSVFEKLRFNEDLKQYGYEDLLLAFQLNKANVQILHIDNALYHEGLEQNQAFIDKTKQGIENLSNLYDSITDKKMFADTVQLISTYNKLKFFGLTFFLREIYYRFQMKMELSLNRSNPKIWIFGLYKMSMFCKLRYEKNSKRKI